MTGSKSKSNGVFSFLALLPLCSHLLPTAHAILPTAAIDVQVKINDGSTSTSDSNEIFTLLASQGNFAPMPPMSMSPDLDNDQNQKLVPLYPPPNDPLLCGIVGEIEPIRTTQPFVFLVPRGTCTFQEKTLVAQKYGASGVIIYGTLSSRYGFNETTGDVVYPQEYYDYDCSKKKGKGFGRAYIPASKLVDVNAGGSGRINTNGKPYNSANDPLLSADGGLCFLYSDYNSKSPADYAKQCPSQRCLLTGNATTPTEPNADAMVEACCAWDTHVFLYHDDSMYDSETGRPYEPINIPSFYITMEEATTLLDTINNANNANANVNESDSAVYITMYSRWYPKYNISTVLIWAVGVFVAALASYLSASEIRLATKQIQYGNANLDYTASDDTGSGAGNSGTSSSITSSDNDQRNEVSPTPVSTRGGYERVSDGSSSGSGSASNSNGEFRKAIPPEETLELTPMHAIFFLVFSSLGLLTLFFFKIYNVVKIFYAFGCSGAIMQVIVMPLYHHIAKKLNLRNVVAFTTDCLEIGSVTVIDILAVVTSYGLGGVWIFMAFTCRHPDSILFFWIMQDIMGACMCIMFLQTMKLNSIRVATILLIAAFFYDIFFVFVTPFLTKGGKSIMVDVATSGGPPQADPSWCEKYPDGPECQGGGKFYVCLCFCFTTFASRRLFIFFMGKNANYWVI